MSDKTNRKQVALEAGVSEATVSRVYNNPDSVSPKKVAKVKKAAKKLGYTPNKYASALRRKGTGVIMFLENRSDSRTYKWVEIRYYNAFYAEIIRAVSREADKSLYHLRLHSVSSNQEILEFSQGKDCDGIIGFNFEEEHSMDIFKKVEIPYVCCHHTETFKGVNRISTDNFHGGFLQSTALRKKGYSSPVYVTGTLEETISHKERLKGFLSGYPDSSIPVLQTDPSLEGGYQVTEKIVEDIRRKKIDAIGVVNDLTAIGIIQKLLAIGIKIPRDVAIIGYDNIPAISVLPISLTTIDLSLPKIYQTAFSSLIEIIRYQKPIAEQILPILKDGNSI